MTNRKLNSFIITIGLITCTMLLFSCRKELPTTATIRVVDTEGAAVSNAMIRLYAISTTIPQRPPIIDDTLYSDASGQAIFDYSDRYNLGQAGLAVLEIEVQYETFSGIGIIKIEEEKANKETVIIQ